MDDGLREDRLGRRREGFTIGFNDALHVVVNILSNVATVLGLRECAEQVGFGWGERDRDRDGGVIGGF